MSAEELMIEREAMELRSRARRSFRDIEWHMGALIAAARPHGHKPGDMAKKLGIGHRKAYYLEKLYHVADSAGLTVQDIAGLGWSTLKEIAPILTSANKHELLGVARKMSILGLRAYVRDRGDSPTPVAFVLRTENRNSI